jgi:hypothetical protein
VSSTLRSYGLAVLLVGNAACKDPAPSGPAPADAPAAEATGPRAGASEMPGETVDVRIVERHNVEGGIEHRITAAGRRGTLFAGTGTALAAASEANEVITVELAARSGSEADHEGGALLVDGETRRIVAFDAWMLPADTVSHGSLVGVWRVPKAGREFGENGTIHRPGVAQFAYDGKYVVLRLAGEQELAKLESRWVETPDGRDTLQYRAPSGEWKPLAASMFEGKARRFQLAETERIWPLERVRKAGDADADDRALVVDRPLYVYALEEPRTNK